METPSTKKNPSGPAVALTALAIGIGIGLWATRKHWNRAAQGASSTLDSILNECEKVAQRLESQVGIEHHAA